MTETELHLQALDLLAQLEQQGNLVVTRVGAHHEAEGAARAGADLAPQPEAMGTGEPLDDLLQVETEVVAGLEDREVVGLGHGEGSARKTLSGGRQGRPPRGRNPGK